ncbi:MAG: alpha/beta hydrolase [Candidatus Eisenbacteria bacterium]
MRSEATRAVSATLAIVVALSAVPLAPAPAASEEPGGLVAEASGEPGSDVPPQYMVIPEATVEGTQRLVDIEWRKLSSTVYGSGAPTVILLSGLNAPQEYWNAIVPALAAETTVLTYDRAGHGESTLGTEPVTGENAGLDLYMLLGELGVPGPFIVVGHSYGASVARLFASRFPEDIGGIVLIDGQHESVLDEQRKLLTGDGLAKLEEMVVRMKEMAPVGSEAASQQETAEQLRRSAPLPDVPYVVVTAGDRSKAMPPLFSDEAQARLAELGIALQERLVSLVPGGKHVVLEGVGHNIHVEQPEAITAPILEMVQQVRAGGR